MQNEKKKKTQSNLLTTGGALAGAALGTIVAGPLGSVGGALAGTLVEKAVEWGVNEIHTRFLTNSEKRKVTSLIDCSIKKIEEGFSSGKKLRTDDFFEPSINDRSSAEELYEGVLLSAQRECEERKIPFLGNLYANLCFRNDISREVANSILKLANDCTYRDFIILKCVAICQNNENIHKKSAYTNISGLESVSIATDTFTLYRKGILYTKDHNVLLSPGGIDPSNLIVGGVGAFLYMLLELENLPHDELFNKTFRFFSNTIIE